MYKIFFFKSRQAVQNAKVRICKVNNFLYSCTIVQKLVFSLSAAHITAELPVFSSAKHWLYNSYIHDPWERK